MASHLYYIQHQFFRTMAYTRYTGKKNVLSLLHLSYILLPPVQFIRNNLLFRFIK
jgi:hypothetical protein